MTATGTRAAYNTIVDQYVMAVELNGTALDVLADIRDGGHEVTYELLDMTHALGYRHGVESDRDNDAWWDAMVAALPDVAMRLSRTLHPSAR
jgi:hypothetical protein